ncbi:unnamed protein product, partial [Staurois parvus]
DSSPPPGDRQVLQVGKRSVCKQYRSLPCLHSRAIQMNVLTFKTLRIPHQCEPRLKHTHSRQ